MISKKLQWDQQAFVIFYQASFMKKAQNKYDGLHGGWNEINVVSLWV